MPIPKQLTPSRATRSLIGKLAGKVGKIGLVDKVRQIATNLGDRPYNVDLVWTRWSGSSIGVGDETEIDRFPLVPNPVLFDLTAVARNPYSAGVLPVGSIRLTEISAGQTSEDLLIGRVRSDRTTPRTSVDDFFYEVRFDGRGAGPNEAPPQRARYRLLGSPWYDADNVQFVVLLERASEDPSRLGTGVPDGKNGGL
jgi:hypothetical protein